MKLEILGARVLVRAYALPETSAGGIIFPDYYRSGFDGHIFEVIQAGPKVADRLCVAGRIGDKLIPAVKDGFEAEPLILEPDDIIQLRGIMNGVYAGPEVEREMGKCWFVDALYYDGKRDVPSMEWVWPARSWEKLG